MAQNAQPSSPVVRLGFRHFSEAPSPPPEMAQWKNISIVYHRLGPPGECELYLLQHLIRIPLHHILLQRRIDAGKLSRHTLQPGDLLITPATSREWLGRQEHEDFLLLCLEPSLLAQMAEKSAAAHSLEKFRYESVVRDPLLFQIGLALQAEMHTTTASFSPLYVQELTNAFAAHLLRHYTRWEQSTIATPDRLSSAKMRQVTEYIQANLSQSLTLPELAALVAMSPYYFARTFKQATGLSPHQYLMHARIEQARKLLLRGDLSMTQIAAFLGFYDQSHFTRVFKQVVGLTPLTFLQENGKNIPE